MKKLIVALTVPFMALGIGALGASPADAHTPDITASCGGVHVGATAYDGNQANRWSVTIGGVTQTGTFGSSLDQTFPVPQAGATTPWSAFVEAYDGTYHNDAAGQVGPCGTPAPVDECQDLPGNQPAGTTCTAPPEVVHVDAQDLHGCSVSFGGTSYGAGNLTYDEQFTDTYVFNEQTNTFDLVTDTTPTIANVVFTPWTMQQQVNHGCTEKSTQPPAAHTQHATTHLNCDADEQVTTTVTTTTPYVYDNATNTWVPGQTVEHTSTSTQPAQPGDCNDTEVLPAQAHASNGSNGAQVLPASATPQVPTAVDAGLAGAAPVSAPVAAPFVTQSSNDARTPALLLVLMGAALLSVGGLTLRRR